MEREVIYLDKLLPELNKDLENKITPEDIDYIENITGNFTELGKEAIIDENIEEGNKIYCIYLVDDIEFKKIFEYGHVIIKIDSGDYFLFYNASYMELY